MHQVPWRWPEALKPQPPRPMTDTLSNKVTPHNPSQTTNWGPSIQTTEAYRGSGITLKYHTKNLLKFFFKVESHFVTLTDLKLTL